ncbi:YdcF family protein [Curvivirga sp.]|uniref:YdcF family protein n=1 Tax=Curvivirga sp. TaxID=2856848 RepID=UPI003B598D45
MPLLRRNKGRKRKTLAFGILIIASWIVGLFWFIDSIPKTPQTPDRKTDAIVVLTGGTLRLEEGLDLLERGLADKLFVSGVHHAVNVEELLRLSRETPSKLDCCITLGYEADNTQGNAMETALWMHEQGFKSMRLITGGYHMPRSLMELQYVLPNTEIILHPVYPDHVKLNDWYLWPGTSLLIIGEYNKTIFIPIRRLLTRLITAKD